MPIVKAIPEKYKRGYELLHEIDRQTFEAIVEGLSLTALSAYLTRVIENVVAVKSLDHDMVQSILFSIASLASGLEEGHSEYKIAEDVFNVILTRGYFSWADDNSKGEFVERVATLLKSKQIYYAAKSNQLLYEYQNVLLGARIVSDVRPVFDTNLDGAINAGMIIHNLHLHYQKDEESPHTDIFLALDLEDIKSLQEVLARAEKKELAIRAFIDKAGLTNLTE